MFIFKTNVCFCAKNQSYDLFFCFGVKSNQLIDYSEWNKQKFNANKEKKIKLLEIYGWKCSLGVPESLLLLLSKQQD